MGWKDKYKVVRIVPGLIITPWGERLDLSNPNIPEEKIERLHKEGCSFIQPIEISELKPDAKLTEVAPKSTTPQPPPIPPRNPKYGNQKKS